MMHWFLATVAAICIAAVSLIIAWYVPRVSVAVGVTTLSLIAYGPIRRRFQRA